MKSWMAALCVVVVSLFTLASAMAAEKGQPPNVVVFLVDDLGLTDVGCFGSDYHRTPNIDRLAAEGVRFTDAYSACNCCSPTRAALQTGLYPARLHLTDWIPGMTPKGTEKLRVPEWTQHLEPRYFTLAEALKGQGYDTWHVGKWHLGHNPNYYPQHHGYDVNIGGSWIGAPGSYYYPYQGKPGLAWGTVENLPPGGPEGRYLTDRLADETIKLIKSHSDRPFFVHHAFHSVHTPIQPRADLLEHYQKDVPPGKRHTKPEYAAMVAAVDEAIGRVVKQLEESSVADSTLIVFTSDNGGVRRHTDNSPLRGEKGQAYEGGIRVPLIIRWPGHVKASAVNHEPVITMDLAATIRDVAGGGKDDPSDSKLDGVSLVPLLTEPSASLRRDAIYWHYPHYNSIQGTPHSVVRAGRYKLIEFFEDGRLELYDLQQDVGEQHDLSKSLLDLTRDLHTRLQRWRQSVGAQMPIPKPETK